MGDSWKSIVKEFVGKLAALHEQMARNSAEFEGIRKTTSETMAEFKQLLRELEANVRTIENERIRQEAKLNAKIDSLKNKIDSLEQKLSMLSQQAMLQAMKTVIDVTGNKRLFTGGGCSAQNEPGTAHDDSQTKSLPQDSEEPAAED